MYHPWLVNHSPPPRRVRRKGRAGGGKEGRREGGKEGRREEARREGGKAGKREGGKGEGWRGGRGVRQFAEQVRLRVLPGLAAARVVVPARNHPRPHPIRFLDYEAHCSVCM